MKLIQKTLIAASMLGLSLVSTQASSTFYYVDFVTNSWLDDGITANLNSTASVYFNSVIVAQTGGTLFNAVDVSLKSSDQSDTAPTLTFSTGTGDAEVIVKGWATGDSSNLLTSSGWFVGGSSSFGFSIGGLSAGDLVTVYSLAAWAGNNNAGYISIGSGASDLANATQALTVGTPGNTPTLSNFTKINSTPVEVDAGETSVDGRFWGGGHEGQFGGLVVEVESVPEPATWAMMLGGLGVLVSVNRFRKFRGV